MRLSVSLSRATSNNRMHPTRDTTAFIYSNLVGGRVMPGVSWQDQGKHHGAVIEEHACSASPSVAILCESFVIVSSIVLHTADLSRVPPNCH